MQSLNANSSRHPAISRQQISDNFTLAKFLSIIIVATGHFFKDLPIWVLDTVGLFIFAFSSGYFTSIKHNKNLPLKVFWIAKLKRLGPPLIVINLFLCALFLIQGREGIWHPHTLLGITGLTGLLNWLGIKNQTPYGAGLWFMTVLIIFYLVYPILAKSLKTTHAALIFLLLSAFVCTLGHLYASPPYMLWPTIFGFCLGTVAGKIDWHPRLRWSILLGVASLIIMLALNAAGFRQFNVLTIVFIAIASVAFLLSFPLNPPVDRFNLLCGSILEIYLIHGYLFVRPSEWPVWLSYLVSMSIVLLVSVALNLLTHRLISYFGGAHNVATVK